LIDGRKPDPWTRGRIEDPAMRGVNPSIYGKGKVLWNFFEIGLEKKNPTSAVAQKPGPMGQDLYQIPA
jgi:hypothetical protein